MPAPAFGRIRRFRGFIRDAALLTVLWIVAPVDVFALDIALTYSGGFEHRSDAVVAMEQAATMWEHVLSDPIVVEIDVREVSFLDLPFGVQGATFSNWYEESYPDVREALVADATSCDDAVAVAHLQPGPRLSFQTWDAQQNVVTNDGDDWINNWVALPRANLKALGLPIEGERSRSRCRDSLE